MRGTTVKVERSVCGKNQGKAVATRLKGQIEQKLFDFGRARL